MSNSSGWPAALRLLVALTLCAAACAGRADGMTGPIHHLGSFGGPSSQAWAVNAKGQVVGVARDSEENYRAFRYDGAPGSGGGMHDLGTFGGDWGGGYGI